MNYELIFLLATGIGEALEIFRANGEHDEITIMTDLDEGKLVFAYGDADGVESSEDSRVFYQFDCSDAMKKATEKVQYLEEHKGTPNLTQEVAHWLGDALGFLEDELEEMEITINGHYDYGMSDWDPLHES